MAVNKTELVNRMAEKGGIKKAKAYEAIDLVLETLMDCLREKGTVKLQNFGKFEIKTVKERIGRNPKTGEECLVPVHRKVKFYPSEMLIDRIERG